MHKTTTNYTFDIPTKGDPHAPTSVDVEVNEEYNQHIRVKYFDERWRTKKEFIALYKGIIKELESFTP